MQRAIAANYPKSKVIEFDCSHEFLVEVPKEAAASISEFTAAPALRRRRYSSVVNARLRAAGRFFQSRFGSAAMNEEHRMTAARSMPLNRVRAKLVARA